MEARTQAEIDVPGGPDLPVAAFGSLWLLTPDGDVPSVTRIDPATNEIVATIAIDWKLCQALGVTDDAVWVCSPEGAARIDPATNEIVDTVEFDHATSVFFGYLPFGDEALWALGGDAVARDQVVRIDPVANEVTARYELDFDASSMSYGENALWITDTTGGTLWRLDPRSGEVSAHVTDLHGPGPSAVGAGSIWLAVRIGPDDRPTSTDVTLVRINAETGEIEAEIVLGGSIGEAALYADDDAVWFRAHDPFLAHIDPATNEVVESFAASRLGGSLTVAYDSVWATSYGLHRVWRIRP